MLIKFQYVFIYFLCFMLIEIICHADHLNFQSEEETFSFPLHNKYRHTDYNFSDDDRYASNSNSFLFSLTMYCLSVLYTLDIVGLLVLLWSMSYFTPLMIIVCLNLVLQLFSFSFKSKTLTLIFFF